MFSIVSIYFFWKQVQGLEGDLLSCILHNLLENWLLLCVIVTLALVNWNSEAQKFKLLIKSEIRLSNLRAFLTILGGMAISNFTPARTGEYIGRGLLLKSIHPVKVIIATVTGNIAQVLMTYSLGLLCLVGVLLITDMDSGLPGLSKIWIVLAVFSVILLFVFNAKSILKLVKKHLPSKLAKAFKLIKKYDRKLFIKVVGIAFLRYCAFAIQFYLLLQLFSGFVVPVYGLAFIPVAYLLQSIAPVPAISDVGVRVAVSQLLFGSYLMDNAILQAVTSLWFINLILPGLIGTFYLLFSTIRSK